MAITLNTQNANVLTGAGSYNWVAPADGNVTISGNYTFELPSATVLSILKNSVTVVQSNSNANDSQISVAAIKVPCVLNDAFTFTVSQTNESKLPNVAKGIVTVDFTVYPT